WDRRFGPLQRPWRGPIHGTLPARNGDRSGGSARARRRGWSAEATSSGGLAGRLWPELCGAGSLQFLASPFATIGGEAVEVAGRPAGADFGFPACFKPAQFL